MIRTALNYVTKLSTTTSDDWTAVQRGTIDIPLDLENTPLELRTNSTLGIKDKVVVMFCTTQIEGAGGLQIYFTSTTQYFITYCSSSRTNFPSNLPSEVDKIWRITLDKTAGIRLQIHCNGVEVVNILLSDNTCSSSRWGKNWSRDVEIIYFFPYDTASDYYRAVQTGTCIQLIFHLRHCV